jgi:phage terminase Nu1 subunit (DNA packaging protein)
MAKTKAAVKRAAKKLTTAEEKRTVKEKLSLENNPESEKRSTMTTEEVAKYLGVSPTSGRISQLKRDGVITPLPSGRRKEGDFYKPLETFIKLARHYRELSDSRCTRETEEMRKARERQLIAMAKNEELDLSEGEGELHKAEDIERVMGAVLTRLRINLLAIPKGVASQLKNQDNENVITEKINERIRRALNEVVSLDLDALLAEEEK